MSLWDDLWNALWGALATPFAAADNALLGYVPSAIEYTPNLGTSAVQTVWTLVYVVFLGSLGIAVAGIGLLYILTPVVEKKVRLKFLWTKLAFALVLGGSSILIGNFTIQLANQLTQGLLSGVSVSVFGQNYWGNSVNALGPGSFIVYLIALIFIVMVLIENGVRILMIFFAGAILPIGYLLWVFPITASYGTKIIKMFFEWTFLNVFMAITLLLTVTVINQASGWSDFEAAFVLLAGLSLTAAMPKVMTESGSAVGNVGQAVMGGMFGAESIGGGVPGGAGMGMGGGAGMAAGGAARGFGAGMAGQASRAFSSAGRLGVMNPVAGMAALGTGVATLGAKAAVAGGRKVRQRMQPNYHANQATRHMGLAKQASDAGNVKGADKHMAKAGKHLGAQVDRMNKKSTFDTMVRWARHQETFGGVA